MRHHTRSSGTQYGLGIDVDEHWSTRSVCRDDDPELMWPLPHDYAAIEEARKVCKPCPVGIECLREGIELLDWESVRGGLTGEERKDRHRQGFALADYPPPPKRMGRWCVRCQTPFVAESRFRRVCESCDRRRNKEVSDAA